MKELYWIERLDAIRNLASISLFIVAAVTVFLIIYFFISHIYEEEIKNKDKLKTLKKTICIIMTISALILTFTPSTNEMYKILAIGGTIDYLRDNETAKQLPDKCIKAIDVFLDNIISEKPEDHINDTIYHHNE